MTNRLTDRYRLTEIREKIRKLHLDDGLTYRQIATLLKLSKQYVNKELLAMSKHGLLTEGGSTHQLNTQKFELHGIQLDIKPHFTSDSYLKRVQATGRAKTEIDGCTIICYRTKIEVYTGEDLQWMGESCSQVTAMAMSFLNRLIVKAENRLMVVLMKNQSDNCRIVASHYAKWNAELSRWAHLKDYAVKCHATDDGKLWLLCDNSKGRYHMETVHPNTAKEDMEEVIDPFMNDLRDSYAKTGELIRPSELLRMMQTMARENLQTAKHLQDVAATLSFLMRQEEPIIDKKVSSERPTYIG